MGYKQCPVCHARCFEDMDICYGCMHRFDEPPTPPLVPTPEPMGRHAMTDAPGVEGSGQLGRSASRNSGSMRKGIGGSIGCADTSDEAAEAAFGEVVPIDAYEDGLPSFKVIPGRARQSPASESGLRVELPGFEVTISVRPKETCRSE